MNLMKFFGFDDADDDYDDDDEYEERERKEEKQERRKKSSQRRENSRSASSSGSVSSSSAGKLILYNGIANDEDKRKLCDAFNDGAMILIDLHTLSQRDFEERGERFITFMGGIAYARKGDLKYIEPAQYLITPREGMFEIWPEEHEQE
ncbi:MAG: cell division protein SepF [Synergistaceae bacterium]|nr:cell division protein SepF [Synergistaceae bacterium]